MSLRGRRLLDAQQVASPFGAAGQADRRAINNGLSYAGTALGGFAGQAVESHARPARSRRNALSCYSLAASGR